MRRVPRLLALAAAIVGVAYATMFAIDGIAGVSAGKTLLPPGSTAPEFAGIEGWLNTDPLRMADLRGKVVLVDFWTYSCINCVRTLSSLTRWHRTYQDQGLVIVGVHTPEFAYERESAKLQNAMRRYHIEYPVAQDNGYATWQAYHNQYWPAQYLIDRNGKIVLQHFGEGDYDDMERAIRRLLAQAPPEDATLK